MAVVQLITGWFEMTALGSSETRRRFWKLAVVLQNLSVFV
jgi:hypothetical protein